MKSCKLTHILLAITATLTNGNVRGRYIQQDQATTYCGECLWHDGRTCDHRKEQIQERQKLTEQEAIQSLMAVGEDGITSPCALVELPPSEAPPQEPKATPTKTPVAIPVQTPVDSLSILFPRFCANCLWHGKIRCEDRAQWMVQKYAISLDDAVKNAMENPLCCKEGVPPAEPIFCDSCEWQAGINCLARLNWVVHHHKVTREQALAAMFAEGRCTTTEST